MSALPTLEIAAKLLPKWESSFSQFGLTLNPGLGSQNTNVNRTEDLFHLADESGSALIWIEVNPVVSGSSDKEPSCLVSYSLTPHLPGARRKTQRLVARNFELLLLASGGRKLVKKRDEEFIARLDLSLYATLPQLLALSEAPWQHVDFSSHTTSVEPYAIATFPSVRLEIYRGQLMDSIEGFSHYVAFDASGHFFGGSKHHAAAEAGMNFLLANADAQRFCALPYDHLFEIVST